VTPTNIELIGAALFAVAILHTFATHIDTGGSAA
jgi:hypothetical protein